MENLLHGMGLFPQPSLGGGTGEIKKDGGGIDGSFKNEPINGG